MLIQALPLDYGNLFRVSVVFHQALRARLGLDDPLWVQYLSRMGSFFSGELGVSFRFSAPVRAILVDLAPRTLLLFLSGTLVGFSPGPWLGRQIGWKRDDWVGVGGLPLAASLSTPPLRPGWPSSWSTFWLFI